MRELAVSGHFQKQLKKLHRQDQGKVTAALKTFLESLQKGNSPAGLGFKKINGVLKKKEEKYSRANGYIREKEVQT
jgi:mRNA-degrading endonuclease RelE of RelBE toxin-antitoxin system